MHANSATIEIAQPRLFTLGTVLTVSAYGLLLMAPLFMAILVVSLIKFGIQTVLIPFVVAAGTAYFLPFGLGNTHITRLVRSLSAAAGKGEEGFIVQLALSPRIRSGLRAILEDADDIGYLTFERDGLRFAGDSVKLFIPYECVGAIRPQNIGLRGAFVYGRRIKVLVSDLLKTESLEFAERGSCFLPSSRRTARELYAQLAARVGEGARAEGSVGSPG